MLSSRQSPERHYENNLISDFFAEIYVFQGKFKSRQVLASDTLKNYFVVTNDVDEDGEYVLRLRDKVTDAFGDPADTLDALYSDKTSHPIGHWVGSLIPYFKNKQGYYQALDILFNQDQDTHHMMMSFNIDMLEDEESANIDLSGRSKIPTEMDTEEYHPNNGGFDLNQIFEGTARTNLLGNLDAPVVADILSFHSNAGRKASNSGLSIQPLHAGKTRITGTLYVDEICEDNVSSLGEGKATDSHSNYIKLIQVGATDNSGNRTIYATSSDFEDSSDSSDVDDSKVKTVTIYCASSQQVRNFAARLGVPVSEYDDTVDNLGNKNVKELRTDVNGLGTFYHSKNEETAFMDESDPLAGPQKVITAITRIEPADSNTKDVYTDLDVNLKASFMTVTVETEVSTVGANETPEDSVYGSSVTFIKTTDNWVWRDSSNPVTINGVKCEALITTMSEDDLPMWDKSLMTVLHVGDCILADDGTNDNNENGTPDENFGYTWNDNGNSGDLDTYYDNVYVQASGTEYYSEADKEVQQGKKKEGDFKFHYILFSGRPAGWTDNSGWYYDKDADGEQSTDLDDSAYDTNASYIVRIDAPLNQEIGKMIPQYLEGYTYKNDRPAGTDMMSKVHWQDFILSTLTDYKGLRTGLLNKAEIDYRYVIDTFESYPVAGLKKILSMLCKEKESAFSILNFPSIKNFVKCPYTSFTDVNGVFDINYVVAGYNKKKPSSIKFSLPSENDGASFAAFYTPLRFSDGYVDYTIPSAGLVSNLFMEKYLSRQPYYIVAGPNYAAINARGLVGPDYKYSKDELQIIEPFGVNCMVFRPNFGTFVNANQTAKQTPLSALSKVNVRELVIYLQDEIEKVLQAYQWEFNNATTRNAILDRANQICALVAANGGIQAYHNTMDESNNTDEIIDYEMAVISTAIEPGMGCGKMVQELTLYRTGQMSSNIIE